MAQLEDLNDDCLLEVLDRLPPNELVKLIDVNRRLKRLASDKLREKIKVILWWELDKEERFLPECGHLNSVNCDQVLIMEPIIHNLLEPSRSDLFMSVSTKCTSVKIIEFGFLHLSDEMLLELFRRCPELECIKLAEFEYFMANNWNLILDSTGHRIVHFVKISYFLNIKPVNFSSLASAVVRLLMAVAEKCPNIKRVDWSINWPLTNDLVAAFKMLPDGCWRSFKIESSDSLNGFFEDVFDELNVSTLDLTLLGHRVDRLSSLKFLDLDGDCPGVEFANLKKLEFKNSRNFSKIVGNLLANQYPRLEEFIFDAIGVSEEEFDGLFQQMPSVKKLTILFENDVYLEQYFEDDEDVICLPGSSIHHLNDLEIIVLKFGVVIDDWKPGLDFLQQLVKYVKEIDSLKKLVVDLKVYENELGKKRLLNAVKQLKLKQNRVEVVSVV